MSEKGFWWEPTKCIHTGKIECTSPAQNCMYCEKNGVTIKSDIKRIK